MNEVQRAAIARADEQMKPALELYEKRSTLFRLVCTIPRQDLDRVCRALENLTPDDLVQLLDYAEGLAAWRVPAQESSDAEISQGADRRPDSAGT